jgi:hypothetical protein
VAVERGGDCLSAMLKEKKKPEELYSAEQLGNQ